MNPTPRPRQRRDATAELSPTQGGGAPAVAAAPTTARRLRSIVGGSVGNLVEWYDWYVDSAFSLYFARAFFPPGRRTTQLLNAAAGFAVGSLMRPVGGLLMGWYADRRGRRAALTGSVLLMCLASLLIALTPGYESIGCGLSALGWSNGKSTHHGGHGGTRRTPPRGQSSVFLRVLRGSSSSDRY